MECATYKNKAIKNGHQKDGTQRYFCKWCRISFQNDYLNNAYKAEINESIRSLLIEGCGTLSVARLLRISPNTVTQRVLVLAENIRKPLIPFGKSYEVDEMFTYLGNKNHRICIAYAIDRQTREVVRFSVGRRNLTTLRVVTQTLVFSNAHEIRTDRLNLYQSLIPKEIHQVKRRGISRIERKNLTLRTHLKRLNRRTMAYSKSTLVLSALLKIYFWS